jgi:hypothetical protein
MRHFCLDEGQVKEGLHARLAQGLVYGSEAWTVTAACRGIFLLKLSRINIPSFVCNQRSKRCSLANHRPTVGGWFLKPPLFYNSSYEHPLVTNFLVLQGQHRCPRNVAHID